MKTIHRNLFAMMVALLGVAPMAVAQEPAARSAASPVTITYEEAIGIALRQNLAVRRAENATALQAAGVKQQQGQFLPTLRLSAQGSGSTGRTFSEAEGRIVDETTKSLNAGISSSVTLFDGFRNVANLKSAKLGEEASEYELERARQTAVMTVASNFLGVIEGEEQVRVRREALAAQEAELKQVEAMVEAGSRPIADLYQQQANVASARAALVEAERTLEAASLELISTLQLDPAGEYRFQAPSLESSAVGGGSLDEPLDALIERALQRRVDLQALAAREAAAAQGVRAAAAGRYPTVSLSAGYNTGASSTSPLSLSEQLDQRRGGYLTLGVSIPLFDGFQVSAETERARTQLDNARLDLQERRQQVALEVRRARSDLAAAQERLEAAEAQLAAAELALEATTERYRVGAANLLEVTQARTTQVEAASAVVNARYNLLLQRTLVDYYVGELEARVAAGS